MSTTKPSGRFVRGTSGNPLGRRPGQRNKATLVATALLDEHAAGVVNVVVKAALGGDLGAARALLQHVVPRARERTMPAIALPAADDAASLDKAQSEVIDAVARGELTATEAQALAGLLELRRRSIETLDIENRLAALELERDIAGIRPRGPA